MYVKDDYLAFKAFVGYVISDIPSLFFLQQDKCTFGKIQHCVTRGHTFGLDSFANQQGNDMPWKIPLNCATARWLWRNNAERIVEETSRWECPVIFFQILTKSILTKQFIAYLNIMGTRESMLFCIQSFVYFEHQIYTKHNVFVRDNLEEGDLAWDSTLEPDIRRRLAEGRVVYKLKKIINQPERMIERKLDRSLGWGQEVANLRRFSFRLFWMPDLIIRRNRRILAEAMTTYGGLFCVTLHTLKANFSPPLSAIFSPRVLVPRT